VLFRSPSWTEIYQCSFHISGAKYSNLNSDEDDWQGWEVRATSWELVQQGTTKKIRLKFSLAQFGEYTIFEGVSYHVIATGDLGTTLPTPPVKCDKRLYEDFQVDTTNNPIPPHDNPKYVIDGDENTFWLCEQIIHPYITLSWTDPKSICRVDILWGGFSEQYYFRIAISNGWGFWTDVYSGKSTGFTGFEKYEFVEQKCTEVRITVTESEPSILPKSQLSIKEIAIYGKPV